MNLYCSPPGQTSLAGGNRSCPDRQDSIALEIAGSHQKRDLETLEEIISADIPETLDAIDDLQEVFRIRWLCGFKPYKLNWLQIRPGQLSDDPVDAFEPHCKEYSFRFT